MYSLLAETLALIIAWTLGYFLPRFSAYFLGPAFLAIGGLAFITLNKYFFPFQSDGSPAGLIVPGMLWIGLITCCLMGGVLIGVGRSRTRSSASSEAADHTVTADRPNTIAG